MASLIDQMNQGILARRQALTPLLVVAPSTRCGTTLMQRLLTASREMLVYGENALLFEIMPQVYSSVLQTFGGEAGAAAERLRAKVAGGDTAGWIAGVLADPNRMQLLAARQLVEHFVLHQEDAAALGFGHWGLKYPLANTSALPVLTSLMPNIKVLVIHRPVLDALKSAKGRGWIEGGSQAEAFASSWSENLAWLSAWEFPGKMTVRYDDMIADPDAWLPKIAAFAGIERIDPSVLAVKVNTFEGSGEGEDPSGYTPPIDLTDAEKRRALAVSAPGLAAGGY
jgi:hypothetical protein